MPKRAFTLIELLIVVAIIAILAAIAVPNFLEAQTRAKVSRTRADLRSVAVAIEAYQVDYNKYPAPMEQHSQVAWPGFSSTLPPPYHGRHPSLLTSPVAYITSIPGDPFRSTKAVLLDPFMKNFNSRFSYTNFQFTHFAFGPTPLPTELTLAEGMGGIWFTFGVGPDQDEGNRIPFPSGTPITNQKAVFIDYDPTNGTVSAGNIFRTHRLPERLGVDPYFYN
jgi:type II secretion system protein G